VIEHDNEELNFHLHRPRDKTRDGEMRVREKREEKGRERGEGRERGKAGTQQ
jgi:ribosomal protein L19E